MQEVEVDDHHQAPHQDPQGEFSAAPDEAGHDQHGQNQPVGYLQPSRGQDIHGTSLKSFTHGIDLPETGDYPHDQPDDFNR